MENTLTKHWSEKYRKVIVSFPQCLGKTEDVRIDLKKATEKVLHNKRLSKKIKVLNGEYLTQAKRDIHAN